LLRVDSVSCRRPRNLNKYRLSWRSEQASCSGLFLPQELTRHPRSDRVCRQPLAQHRPHALSDVRAADTGTPGFWPQQLLQRKCSAARSRGSSRRSALRSRRGRAPVSVCSGDILRREPSSKRRAGLVPHRPWRPAANETVGYTVARRWHKVGFSLVHSSPFCSWTWGSWSTSACRHGPSLAPEHR